MELGLDDTSFEKQYKALIQKRKEFIVPVSFDTKQIKSATSVISTEMKKVGGVDLSKPMGMYQEAVRKANAELKVLIQMQKEAVASNKTKLAWSGTGQKQSPMEFTGVYNKEIDATIQKIKQLEGQIKNLKTVAPLLGKGTGQIGQQSYYSPKDESTLKNMATYYKNLEVEMKAVAVADDKLRVSREKTNKQLIKTQESDASKKLREETAERKKAEKATLDYAKAQDRAYQSAIKARMGSKQFNDQIALTNKTLLNSRQAALQLSNQFGTMFSIYAVERFVAKLLEVRGAFEMQQVSLRAILQDAPAADRIFSQVKALAVESPFTFMDLVSYTKQLSAFSVPVNELFSTMKNLADVSAGLGVDMGRITLAFGQVKAASVLRGQELRQFTEAGIPLVAELANKFSELEGRTVSAGEVFDKISKRMVSFEMIKEIFDDLTSAGGKFYEMQEKQAQSLQGKMSNLKDSFEIMLNSMGAANDDILKGGVEGLTALINNWKEVLDVIGAAIAAYGTYKAVLLTVAATEKMLAALEMAKRFVSLARAISGASTAAVGFGVAMKAAGGPVTLIAAGIAAIVAGLVLFIDKAESSAEMIERINAEGAKTKDFSDKVDKLATSYDELSKKTNLSESEQSKLSATIKVLGSLFPEIITAQNKYGEATAISTEKLRDFNEEQKKAVTTAALVSKAELIARKKELEAEIKDVATTKKYGSKKTISLGGGKFTEVVIHAPTEAKAIAVFDEKLIKLRADLISVNAAISQQDDLIGAVSKSTVAAADGFAKLRGWAKNFYNATKGKSGLIPEITPENLSGDVSDFKKKLQGSYDDVKAMYDIMAMSKKGIYTAKEIAEQKKSLDAYEYALGVLGGSKQAVKGDLKDEKDANKIFVDNLKERISTIKEAYEWYNKLSKAAGNTPEARASAKATVNRAYPDVKIEDGGIGVNIDRFLNSDALKNGSKEIKAELQNLTNYKRELGLQEVEDKTKQLEDLRQANMTFIQKMEAETKKYQEDIVGLGSDSGAIAERSVKFSEFKANLTEEYAKRSDEYKELMIWMADMSVSEVEAEMQSVLQLLKSGRASTPEQQAAWQQMYVELEKKYKELVADKAKDKKDTSFKDFKKTVTALNNVQSAVDGLISSFDDMGEGIKASLTAISATASGTVRILEGIEAATAKGISAAEKASIILTVISYAIQAVSAIIKAYNKVEEERKQKVVDAIEQYSTMLDVMRDINTEMDDIASKNIFGDSSWQQQLNGIKEMRVAMVDFNALLKKYQSNRSTALAVFDGAQTFANFDYVQAKATLAMGKLDDVRKAYLEGLISAYEDYQAAMSKVSDYLSSVFGNVGSSIMDSITENMDDVKGAVDDMTSYVSDALWQMVEDIAYSQYFSAIFDSIQKDILAAMGDTNLDDAQQTTDILAGYMASLGTATEGASAYMNTLMDYLNAAGFDVTPSDGGKADNSLRANIENIKEDTATKLSGYIAGIAQDSTMGRYNQALIANALTEDGIMIKSEGLMKEVRENIGAMRANSDMMARVMGRFDSCIISGNNGMGVRVI